MQKSYRKTLAAEVYIEIQKPGQFRFETKVACSNQLISYSIVNKTINCLKIQESYYHLLFHTFQNYLNAILTIIFSLVKCQLVYPGVTWCFLHFPFNSVVQSVVHFGLECILTSTTNLTIKLLCLCLVKKIVPTLLLFPACAVTYHLSQGFSCPEQIHWF